MELSDSSKKQGTSLLLFPYVNLTQSFSESANPVPMILILVPPVAGPHFGSISYTLIGANNRAASPFVDTSVNILFSVLCTILTGMSLLDSCL